MWLNDEEQETYEDLRDDYREQQRLEDISEIDSGLIEEVSKITPEEVKKSYKEYQSISKIQDLMFPGVRRT